MYPSQRFSPTECFPTFGKGCMLTDGSHRVHFFRGWHQLHVFPHLASVACFYFKFSLVYQVVPFITTGRSEYNIEFSGFKLSKQVLLSVQICQ